MGVTADIEPQNVPDRNPAGTYILKLKTASIADTNYAVGGLFDGTLTIEAGAAGNITSSVDSNSKPEVTNQKVNSARTGDTAPVTVLIIAVVAAAAVIIGIRVIVVRGRRN